MLHEELTRLQGASWYEALHLLPDANKAQIRAAFLRDTKRFHPNRFARRNRQIARLANEVFLLIKGAYYGLSGTGRGGARGRMATSNPIDPAARTRSSQAGMRPPSSRVPPPSPAAASNVRPSQPRSPGSRSGMRVPPRRAGSRSDLQAPGSRTSRAPSGRGTGSSPTISGRATGPQPMIRGPGSQSGIRTPPRGPSSQPRIRRPGSQSETRGPGSQSGMRVPPRGPGSQSGMRVPPRGSGSQPGMRATPTGAETRRRPSSESGLRAPESRDTSGRYSSSAPSVNRRAPTNSDVRMDSGRQPGRGRTATTKHPARSAPRAATARPGQGGKVRRPPSPRIHDPEEIAVAEGLVRALQLGESGQWNEAMALLQKLFKSHPNDRRIQAYAHFIRGREYEQVGNIAKARNEYQRALAVDPSLDAAHRAMNGLRARTNPPQDH